MGLASGKITRGTGIDLKKELRSTEQRLDSGGMGGTGTSSDLRTSAKIKPLPIVYLSQRGSASEKEGSRAAAA
jgi:hypothetical protein